MDVATLQRRLERHEPTLVVDIRDAAARKEWAIPGSIWLDTMAEVWDDDWGKVDAFRPNPTQTDAPVVFVCNVGRTSQKVVEHLRDQSDYLAESLDGGMQAWNNAYNTANAEAGNGVRITQFRRTGKGCLSYLIASEGKALLIDANLDPHVYLDAVKRDGLDLIGALDTHIHADHLSRSHLIARHLNVPYHISDQAKLSFAAETLHEGDELDVGAGTLQVLSTPGHTWDSSTYRVGDTIITGDTLFVDGVGRPDLGAGKQEVADRAHALHESVRRLTDLGDGVRVMPAHASEPLPFDEVAWSARIEEVRARVALLGLDEDEFVDTIVARTPDVPPTYMRMVQCNKEGVFPEDEAAELEAGANRCASG